MGDSRLLLLWERRFGLLREQQRLRRRRQYASADEYYEQASSIASSAPAIEDDPSDDIEWMPLGVFAITSEGVSASSMYLQLAISKDAVIAGTFYNETTGVTYPVEGMVDEETQRAAWHAADGSNADLVMETGVYNLTKEETEVLVHFGLRRRRCGSSCASTRRRPLA